MKFNFNTVRFIIMIAVLLIVFLPIDAMVAATGNVYDNLINKEPVDNDKQLTNKPVDKEPKISTGNNNWLFLKAFLKLVLATALIIIFIYYGAKFLGNRKKGFQGSTNIQTLAVHALGQNKNIQLIRIDKKIYILGVSDNINLIKELSYEESESIYNNYAKADVSGDETGNLTNQFDKIFKKNIEEYKKRNESSSNYNFNSERENI